MHMHVARKIGAIVPSLQWHLPSTTTVLSTFVDQPDVQVILVVQIFYLSFITNKYTFRVGDKILMK